MKVFYVNKKFYKEFLEKLDTHEKGYDIGETIKDDFFKETYCRIGVNATEDEMNDYFPLCMFEYVTHTNSAMLLNKMEELFGVKVFVETHNKGSLNRYFETLKELDEVELTYLIENGLDQDVRYAKNVLDRGNALCFNFEDVLNRFMDISTYKAFEMFVTARIVGQPAAVGAIYEVYSYIKSIALGNVRRHNFIITGPSGCGKTELLRSIEHVLDKFKLKLPIMYVSAAKLTAEGFKGEGISQLLNTIKTMTKDSNGYGIMFLDELDKKLIPSYDSQGMDVNAYVAYELLTLIEGTKTNDVDTSKILFIGAGTFNNIRKAKKKVKKTPIGFDKVEEEIEDVNEMDITFEHIVESGVTPEFIGRFEGGIYNFKKLDPKIVNDIVERFAYDVIVNEDNINVVFEDGALDYYAKCSQGEFGIRAVKTSLTIAIQTQIRKILIDEFPNYSKYNYVVLLDENGGARYMSLNEYEKQFIEKDN